LLFMHFLICKHKTTTTYMLASCLHSWLIQFTTVFCKH
jgi:hypothetical protein